MSINNFLGTTNNNWSVSTNWSLGVVPTATDGNIATFTSSSPNCTINIGNAVCNGLDLTNYTHTISFSNSLGVSGDITLGASVIYSSTGGNGLVCNKNGNLTSHGSTFTPSFTVSTTSSTVTMTLIDAWKVNNFTTSCNAGNSITLNGNSITCYGTVSLNSGTSTASTSTNGTTIIILSGLIPSSSFLGTGNGFVSNPFTFSGSYSLPSFFNYSVGTFTYTSGTLTGSCTMNIIGNCTLSSTSYVLPINLTISPASSLTVTLSNNIYFSGNLTTSGTIILAGSGNLFFQGNYNANGTIAGIPSLNFYNPSGLTSRTWSGTGITNNNVNINLSYGTLNFSGIIQYRTGILTYTYGTINTGTSTLEISGNCTLNTGGIQWYNVLFNTSANNICTLTSSLNVTNALTFTGSLAVTQTISGAYGFNTEQLIINSGTRLILTSGISYNITNSLIMNGIISSFIYLSASSTGIPALFILGATASLYAYYVSATDIDSRAGQTIFVYDPILSDALNWNSTESITYGNSINESIFGQLLIPPDKRLPIMTSWVNNLLVPAQWLNILNGIFANGTGNMPLYNSTASYLVGDLVVGWFNYQRSVFMSLSNSNLGNSITDTTHWQLIVDSFIGMDERILYGGNIPILEWGLNHYFGTVFRQNPAIPDIYINDINLPFINFYISDYTPMQGLIYSNTSRGYITDVISTINPLSGNNFQIKVPLSFYESLPGYTGAGTVDKYFTNFVDRYCYTGLRYVIVTY